MYPGSRGSTHGDRKENAPATSATINATINGTLLTSVKGSSGRLPRGTTVTVPELFPAGIQRLRR